MVYLRFLKVVLSATICKVSTDCDTFTDQSISSTIESRIDFQPSGKLELLIH